MSCRYMMRPTRRMHNPAHAHMYLSQLPSCPRQAPSNILIVRSWFPEGKFHHKRTWLCKQLLCKPNNSDYQIRDWQRPLVSRCAVTKWNDVEIKLCQICNGLNLDMNIADQRIRVAYISYNKGFETNRYDSSECNFGTINCNANLAPGSAHNDLTSTIS